MCRGDPCDPCSDSDTKNNLLDQEIRLLREIVSLRKNRPEQILIAKPPTTIKKYRGG